jgi:hypothetical protein
VTAKAALFRIGPRSGEVLEPVLRDSLPRVISCDHYCVYEKRAREHPGQDLRRRRAHLDREFRRRADHLDPEIGRFGKIAHVKPAVVVRLHRMYTGLEDPGCPEGARLKALMREAFERPGRRAAGAPRIRNTKARAPAKRFGQGFGSYTRFIDVPGAGPTNNAAERALRHAAPDRKNSCGAQSEEGALFLEVMRAAFAATRMRGEAFFHNAAETLAAFYDGRQTPSRLHPMEPVTVKYMEVTKDMRRKLKKTKKADDGGADANGERAAVPAVVPARAKREIRFPPPARPRAVAGAGRPPAHPEGPEPAAASVPQESGTGAPPRTAMTAARVTGVPGTPPAGPRTLRPSRTGESGGRASGSRATALRKRRARRTGGTGGRDPGAAAPQSHRPSLAGGTGGLGPGAPPAGQRRAGDAREARSRTLGPGPQAPCRPAGNVRRRSQATRAGHGGQAGARRA